MRLIAVLGLVLGGVACGSGGLNSSNCAEHKDEATCAADAACKAFGCGDCKGGLGFAACAPKGEVPIYACPAIACAQPCTSYSDGATCAADARCEVTGCPDCKGGTTFVGCYEKGAGPDLVCLADCASDCGKYTTEAGCETDAACHAVYQNDSTTCLCGVPGCCTKFTECKGGPAFCSPQGTGMACLAPDPICEGDFTVGYGAACSEGCVKKSACATN